MTRKALLGISVVALTVGGLVQAPAASAADRDYQVLVFSKTVGYRHDPAITAGTQTIKDLGAANDFSVTATEDAEAFTPGNLAQYEAVVFLNTTTITNDPASRLFTDDQRSAFEGYIKEGGGYVGVHAAADTEYGWNFYGGVVGAYFNSHPVQQQATVKVEDRAHAGTSHLPQSWSRWDEWYNYQSNPRSTAHVLASLEESSYSAGSGAMGDHPITWCKPYQGGRSWYTGLGHTEASYGDEGFRKMLLGGIRYAAGVSKADCRPEMGYAPLYNGSTAGWKQAGPGGFINYDATLASHGGMGLLWYDTKAYTSYSLKLDWKLTGDANSGVFLGFPPSDDPWSAVNKGYEVQIDATDAADRTTGSVYGFKGADVAPRDAALNPPGEWNTYELLVQGDRLEVFLNGVKINEFTDTDPARSLAGHIGIQNHGTGDEASFRNIRIKDLSATTAVQAESYSEASGVSSFSKAGANSGQTLGYIDPGDWARYDGIALTGATGFKARVVSGGPGGTLQVRTGSPTGPILGSVAVPNTGGWSTYQDVSTTLSNVPAGTGNVYLTFSGSGSGLFDVDDFTFTRGSGSGPIKSLGGLCLDVKGASTADGTQAQVYTCNGTAAQSWTRSGQTLRALGKCLDVNGAATLDGTKVQLWTCNGTAAQNWEPRADGSLVNPKSGKCLDVEGGHAVSDTKVQLRTCNGTAAQTWDQST
ncbi:ThuA domain-containing protein [Streptomyces sp. NBC_00887]|uniref:ThuA domain-containing protein n=1 Tax=Streptomyces sp. NBC_00887 TaxID=2975859 RepID=UPI0038702822|nr:ThuA domain-containing protein [Streptomyces sp. NBC_00887]WSY36289.1 ThuA domain-containing protein [Streptomyces sp. NBC_00887]